MRSTTLRSELLALILAVSAAACAPPADPVRVLREQLLIPFPGRQGLIYPRCDEYDSASNCIKWDRKTEYLLSDAPTRARLLNANIVCNVGGEYYVPCENENALCLNGDGRRPWYKFWQEKPTVEKGRIYLAAEYQRLLDEKTYCQSADLMRGRLSP
jgi:hypothetical protein